MQLYFIYNNRPTKINPSKWNTKGIEFNKKMYLRTQIKIFLVWGTIKLTIVNPTYIIPKHFRKQLDEDNTRPVDKIK